ncbi:MAG: PKD domain-containing protein [Nitrospirae bacterium]|nr:MAG: PKD domain-containing protein [Nitrospirota bacterium]
MICSTKKVLSVSAFICMLSLFLQIGKGAVYAEDASTVRATRVDGAVTRNGVPLKEGDIIERDEKIATKANSAVVLTWSNGSIVELYPETTLILNGIIFESDRKLEKSLLVLEKGRIFAKAQVPEHLFSHFELSAGGAAIMTQGAEFAVKYEETEKKTTIWSILGTVIADTGVQRVRIEDGGQAVLKTGTKPENPAPMPDKIKEALNKTSKRLGGSLLIEEDTGSAGRALSVKIGGVKNRRGNTPYAVKFKALTRGGSGKIKAINWSFGDGESAAGREVGHTFTQGVYVVIVQVEDENGQKATAQINISVEADCGC